MGGRGGEWAGDWEVSGVVGGDEGREDGTLIFRVD